MNKAVLWNINGVGFDAREAAREAARRQGKSLGEWLHGVIADHASELGIEERNVLGQDRIDAVTSRLERMSARSAVVDKRMREDRPSERPRSGPDRRDLDDVGNDLEAALPRRRPARGASDDSFEGHRQRRSAPLIEETEFLLEEAIDTMERRALQAERRTADALASFAKLLEDNEAKRDRERESVTALTQKLSDIEGRLADRDQSPVKGALARLEARLDSIGRRGVAEANARQNAVPAPTEKPVENTEPIRRLEEKLNSILEAVNTRPATQAAPVALQVSPIALAASEGFAASQGEAASRHRRLGDAIATIANRQRALEEPKNSTIEMPPMGDGPREADKLDRGEHGRGPSQQHLFFLAMQKEIASLTAKIDDMRREVTLERRQARPEAAVDLDGLHAEIASMGRALRDLAPRGAVTALENSISVLAKRIEASRDQGTRETVLRPIEDVVDDLRCALASIDPRKTIGSLETELRTIGGKIDDLTRAGVDAGAAARIQDQMQEIRDLIFNTAARPLAVEHIEQQIATLTERIDRQARNPGAAQDLGAPADEIRAMIANPPGAAAFDKIENRLEALAAKVDEAIAHADNPNRRRQSLDAAQVAPDAGSLEKLVRDLGTKIEAVQTPGADNHAVEALQRQIGLLSSRFERSEAGFASLATLERSMQDLFTHLEETRASVETSAARAAREVLRIAVDDGRNHGGANPGHDVATLKVMQDEADRRTQSTLEAVHETLEKVVDRLSLMESDIEEVRAWPRAASDSPDVASRKQTPAAAERPALDPAKSAELPVEARRMTLGAADPLLDPIFGLKPAGRSKKSPLIGPRDKPTDFDEDPSRADFIAAARRAAQAAQTDPSVVAMKRPGSGASNSAARAGLMAKSRDYVSSHKRPVLLSLAAVFVIIGTMAVMQRLTFDGGGPEMAETAPPAGIAGAGEAPPARIATSAAGGALDELTPSALPKSAPANPNPIPGSDPIQTGSIPSLPAFAARASAGPMPTLPAGLARMADAGDGAAQYELGARYADGRAARRDLKLAARWYAKAADQGLAPAQYRLASLYEKGLGVAQDKARAKSLYLKAADAGNPRAMHNLAVLLADGDGKPDYEGAATWFRKAAQYGVHDSQYNLAILLARGLGVEQSLVQSYQWFAIAATQNDADAAKKRDEVGLKLGASDLAVAKALAAAFHPRGADPAATEVSPPPGGWDGASTSSTLNSARAKISSL